MILAHALIVMYFGRSWKLSSQDRLAPFSVYRQILRWFTDSPGKEHVYSIHNIMQKNFEIKGQNKREKVGEWFAPTSIALVLKNLVRTHSPSGMTMHVPRDSTIYIDKVCALAKCVGKTVESPVNSDNDSDSEHDEITMWRPVFILIPIRIGVHNINKIYIPHIKFLLTCVWCVGIIGGKPKASLYFTAYQDDELLYLDPHIVQPAVQPKQEFTQDIFQSFHCKVPQKMPIEHIDPSLAVGILCKTRKEFFDFVEVHSKFAKDNPTIFQVEKKCPSYVLDEEKRLRESDPTRKTDQHNLVTIE